jgi:hypothetical protein
MKQKKRTWRAWLSTSALLLFFLGSLLLGGASTYAVIGINEPIIPCGTNISTTGGATSITNPCEFCHIFLLVHNVYDFLVLIIVPPIAVVLIAIGGFMWLTAGGNEGRVKKGHSMILSVIIGLIIVYVSWLVLSFGIQLIAQKTANGAYDPAVWYNPAEWFDLKCNNTDPGARI